MSDLDPRRYQPCVEDWDEDAESPQPATRTTANVAVKRDISADFDPISPIVQYSNDGTDSGYASQAPTISSRASMASHRRRESDLSSNNPTNIIERERKPYAITTNTTRESERTSTKVKQAEPKEAKPVKKPFCHKTGICWVCDKYGQHLDPKDLPAAKKETSKPPTPAPAPAAAPQPRREAARPKLEDMPKPTRRMSSTQPRPTSMYATAPIQANYQQYANIPHQGWPISTPSPAPIQASAPPQYSYYVPQGTPVYNVQPLQQTPNYYFEPQRVFETYTVPQTQPKPSRRTSMIVTERPRLEKRPSRTQTMMERPVPLEQRPQITAHRSSRDLDSDRAAMPPPPKPTHATINTSRPRQNRSNTYHSTNSSNRHSYYDEEDSDDDEYEVDPRVIAAYREPPSPSRPPSSYRKLLAQQEAVDRANQRDIVERPRLQEKAHSYQQGTKNVQVAGTRGVPRRRTTESAPAIHSKTIEQDVASAEAYMRKRGSYPVIDLTAENLKTLKTVATRQISDQRSESGSTGSHLTHHSSSKDSSNGRGRGVSNGSALGHAPKTSMHININGLNLAITDGGSTNGDGPPVKIDLGAIQLSMNNNNRDKENIDYRTKPPKQLERSESMSSRPSRRSLTNNGAMHPGVQRREEQLAIEAPAPRVEYARRPSYADEDEREVLRRSAKSSRQASRNTSNSRGSQYEDAPVRQRPNRASVDYSTRREESSVM